MDEVTNWCTFHVRQRRRMELRDQRRFIIGRHFKTTVLISTGLVIQKPGETLESTPMSFRLRFDKNSCRLLIGSNERFEEPSSKRSLERSYVENETFESVEYFYSEQLFYLR